MSFFRRYLIVSLAVVIPAFFAACGGGGSSPSDFSSATCSQFTYQEQAQAYFVQFGAKQLDADNDGVACEDLPHNPSGGGGGGGGGGTAVVPSFPSRSAYITTLGSLAILTKTSDFNIDTSWSFLNGAIAPGDSFRLAQGSFPELKYMYIGSALKLQLAYTSSGTLVGLGEWPGFSGFRANALGVTLGSQPVSALNTAAYRFVGQTCRGNQCDLPIKGTLQASGGTLRACPEASTVTETCTGLLRADFTSGGPLWNSASGAESVIIAANGMLSYRKCSGTVSQYQCTTLMGVAATEVSASFISLSNSIGDDGINVGDYVANHTIANLASSTVPGVLTTPTSSVYVIQNKTGDYITYGSSGNRVVLRAQ